MIPSLSSQALPGTRAFLESRHSPAPALEAAGWSSITPSSFHPRQLPTVCPKIAVPCNQNLDPACNFFFFCLSLELPAWLSLHRTGREAPAKRAIPPVMCRRLSASFCRGSLSVLQLKRQQSSCRHSLSSHRTSCT